MDTKDIGEAPPSNWRPESNELVLAALGKQVEECGELIAALGRCICQGVNERHPVTGKPNKQWVEEEMADVRALLAYNVQLLELDPQSILDRLVKKTRYQKSWFDSFIFVRKRHQV